MKKNFIKFFSVMIAAVVLFFVAVVVNAYTFAKSGLCYFASTQFGEEASTQATIHFHSENEKVYAMLTTKDDTTFANAVKVELEKKLVDFSTPLPSAPDKKVEQDEDFPAVSYECTGRLTDLKPGTDYMWYATDGSTSGEVFNFRTADGDNSQFTFTATTDPQTYTGSGVRFSDYYNWGDDVYKTAETNGLDIDFIISIGDQIENSGRATHWSFLFEPNHWRKSVYMATPGNHDFTGLISSGGVDGRYFAAQYGNPLNGPETVHEEICYYYIYNDTLFVTLSCSCANRQAQVEWLDQVLKNNPAKYKIVTMHYPANSDATDNSKEFIPIYDKYNVDLVFFGHTHTYAVQKNYYNRKVSSDKNIGTTYISPSSPEGDYGKPVCTQMYYTVNESIISCKHFTQEGVLHEQFALSAKRANTADTKNYNEEEFINSIKAEIDQDSLNKGKIVYDASAYNNVYKITVMNGETELASRFVTDSVNNYITLSGLTPQTEYNTKLVLEYYDGTTKEVDFAFHTRIASYGSLANLTVEDSAYGYRFRYTPTFRAEVKSLKVYVNDTVVLEPKLTDKRFNIPYESFTDGIVNKIEVKGVLEDGTEVLIHEATYGEEAQVTKYKVTFKDKDGNVISEVEVEEGQAATAPEAPAVEGYLFKEWDKAFDNVTSDLEVNAVYEVAIVEATIGEIIAAENGSYTTTGVVVGTNAQSFLIKDETGIMLVYKGSSWEKDVEVGDKVKVSGETSAYGLAKQFGKEATYEKVETVTVEYGQAKELTVADMESYATAETIKPEYVKVVGTLAVSGKYFNLAIEGTEAVVGSLTYPADQEAVKALDGKKVEVLGYVTGFTGGKYFNILFTEVKEVIEEVPVNKYTVTFKGKDGAVLATVEVEEGQAATAPAAPEVEGFTFKNWDKAFDNVTADLEVNAVYEANEPVVKKYVVVFKDKDGKELATVEVEEGKAATAPNAPEVEGFKFVGWDKAFDNVTADLIITAQYEEAGGCGNSASILFTSLLLLGLVLIRRKEW